MVLENLKRPPKQRCRVFVGLSGGQDSVALLHVLSKKISQSSENSEWHGIKLSAIHINHNLQEDSINFENICNELCKDLEIKLDVIKINIKVNTLKRLGPEAAARRDRFRAFQKVLNVKTDVLALGHHLDDQVETVLLQWMRGAGLEGLTGMLIFDQRIVEKKSINIWRPFLKTTRSEISNYVAKHKLKWINDPSNDNLKLDRNLIRHKVIPLLKSSRNGSSLAMARSINHLQSARSLLEKTITYNLKMCEINNKKNAESFKNLSKELILKLDDELVPRVLRAWIKNSGLSVPPTRRIIEFIRQLRISGNNSRIFIEVNGEIAYKIVCNFDELTLVLN